MFIRKKTINQELVYFADRVKISAVNNFFFSILKETITFRIQVWIDTLRLICGLDNTRN